MNMEPSPDRGKHVSWRRMAVLAVWVAIGVGGILLWEWGR